MEGLIFNIQRYSLNDGEGIRTILFLKGCTLKCPWCSNPESLEFKIQRVKDKKRCINCLECYNSPVDCPTGSCQDIGYFITPETAVEELMKDSIFFSESNGGVTFSGGEALLQSSFIKETAKILKNLGVKTAIETSGHISSEKFKEGIEFINHILFDIKTLIPKDFKELLKGNLELVLKNLELAIEMKKKITLRYPYIPGFTDSKENINEIIKLCKRFNLRELHILPYHNYGSGKYELINLEYSLKGINIPTDEEIKKIEKIFTKENINIKIKG